MSMIGSSGCPVPQDLGSSVRVLPSDADVTEGLLLEFETTYGLRLVSSVIRTCRAELRNAGSIYPRSRWRRSSRGRLAAMHSLSVGAGAA